MSISFSSDTGQVARSDFNETERITEEYFGTMNDPEQARVTPENSEWIYEKARDYYNIVRNDNEVIGYAFMLPCNKKLMNDFLEKRITEAALFEEIKALNPSKPPETIYLCSSIIKKEYQGRGLATTAFVKAISKITKKSKTKPVLFYEGYSEEGEKVARKVATMTGLELRARK